MVLGWSGHETWAESQDTDRVAAQLPRICSGGTYYSGHSTSLLEIRVERSERNMKIGEDILLIKDI